MKQAPILFLVIPCYNEQDVLPMTSKLFLEKIQAFISQNRISSKSRILFVNDGSKDKTWNLITRLSTEHSLIEGICLSRNRGHQNALLAGLMTAKEYADVTISIDCDGQDDLNAMDEMLTHYEKGMDIVYGARSKRVTDTWFKRNTAQLFYRLMGALGVQTVYNHADYRLMSRRALEGLSKFQEVNLFLRGLVPLIGYPSSIVYYEREKRLAGESHYPLKKMLSFAFDGITSLSIRPIRIITGLGFFISFFSVIAIIWAVLTNLFGYTVSGWASVVCAVFFMGGVQLLCLGVIGEYIGKIYNETKARPRFLIQENTLDTKKEEMP